MSDGIHFSLDNLPERYRAQVVRKLAPTPPGHNMEAPHGDIDTKQKRKRVCAPIRMSKKGNEPNHTEAQFNRDVLLGNGKYEALTLNLAGGKYTPDFLFSHDGEIYLVEIKGSYHLPTHGRSVMAFKTACAEYPMFTFLFAELEKNGRVWNIGFYKNGKEVNTVRGTARELQSMK